MVEIQYLCADCKKEMTANVGQSIIDLKLRWYLSCICKSCNTAIEMDDFGFPPDEIRQKILNQEGEWKLKINSLELKNKAKIIKVLRYALNLSIKDTSKLLKKFPYVANGTKVEMLWLKELLINQNIRASIEKQ